MNLFETETVVALVRVWLKNFKREAPFFTCLQPATQALANQSNQRGALSIPRRSLASGSVAACASRGSVGDGASLLALCFSCFYDGDGFSVRLCFCDLSSASVL